MPTQREIEQLASAAPVPMLVVDYTDIIRRYQGLTVEQIETLLQDETELLTCLQLPRQLGVSEEWIRLYGFPIEDDAPDLVVRRFTGSKYPELKNNLIAQFLAPFRGVSEIRSEHMAPTLAGDVTVRSHWKAPTRDGTPDYSRIVIVDLDISDLRATENALEEASKSKDRLMASLAHELRNPLTAVVGFSSILTSQWGAMDDESRLQMAEEIETQVGDVSTLLDDFLTYEFDHSLQVEDLVLTLGDVLSSLDLSDFRLEVDPVLLVRGDPVRIRQIIRNLVRNAQRHGGTQHSLTSRVAEGVVRIEVADNGPGVSIEVLGRLFEPFAHGSTAGSLGLGLAVSHRLAKAMDGDLTYRRQDELTIFELELRAGA
ncbi:MAG TPA: HAMP domain-containing sensor histidine kinase [Acidimicrobiia bacterium]|nr:HAMP domain-containing sensor histidine kinase [Acidimicrobiia bacterium]